MNYFTSDTHFGHTNVIELCNRPFASVEEMDETLIENWNRRVNKNDTVYLVGDVLWDKRKLAFYMERLSGKKILITGNHDRSFCKREECLKYFELVLPYLEVKIDGRQLTLCHYPMVEWRSSRETSGERLGYHIHGHIHNRIAEEYRYLFREFNALNAGVDVNGYEPVSFEELLTNNRRFKLAALDSEDDRGYYLEKERKYI